MSIARYLSYIRPALFVPTVFVAALAVTSSFADVPNSLTESDRAFLKTALGWDEGYLSLWGDRPSDLACAAKLHAIINDARLDRAERIEAAGQLQVSRIDHNVCEFGPRFGRCSDYDCSDIK